MAIQIRRGTNTDWEANKSNIVSGEPAIATDTERVFVGTGSGTFAELANLENMASEYDSTTIYNAGEYCTHQGKLYKSTEVTTGAWDSTKWEEVTVASAVKSEASGVENKIGTLSNLTTTAKSNVVAAVNEVDADVASVKSDLEQLETTVDSYGLSVVDGALCITYAGEA